MDTTYYTLSFMPFYASWSWVLSTFLLTLASIIVYRRWFSPISNIPGPFLASVTRYWHIRAIFRGHQSLTIQELHEKHGPFVRIAPNEVSVSHPDAPKQLLFNPLRKGDWYSIAAVPDYRFKNPFSILDPKEKLLHSKNFASGYTLSNVLQAEDAIDRPIGHLLDFMDKYAGEHKPMDLASYFSFATLDAIGEILFSKPFGFITEGRDINNAIANGRPLNAYAAAIGFFPWAHRILCNPIVTWLGIVPAGYLFDTAVKEIEARKKSDQDTRFDVLAHWLRTQERHPGKISTRDLQSMVTLNVGAGSDSVTCGLQTFVYHMIRRSGWEKARDEIKAAQAQGRCQDRIISYADALLLPYLQACIKEALRVFGPAGMGFPRVVGPEGLTIGDQHFTSGTVLSIHPFTMQVDKEIWGPDAREFKPERWFAADIADKEKAWLVFGWGYAACPGRHIAMVELSKITSTIVRDYDIGQVDPEKEWEYTAYFNTLPHSWPVYIEKTTK